MKEKLAPYLEKLEAFVRAHSRPLIAAVVALALVIGAVTGAYFYARSRIVVDVVPVESVSTTRWGNEAITEGIVSTDVTQRVYLNSADAVDLVLVREGQQVQIGDPLLNFDTTLIALQLEIAELNVEIIKNRIRNKEDEIEKFKQTYYSLLDLSPSDLATDSPAGTGSPVQTAPPAQTYYPVYTPPPTEEPTPEPTVRITPTPVVSAHPGDPPGAVQTPRPTEAPVEPVDPVDPGESGEAALQYEGLEPLLPVSADEPPADEEYSGGERVFTLDYTDPIYSMDVTSEPYAGSGTASDPYRFFVASGVTISADYIFALSVSSSQGTYVILETRQGNSFYGNITSRLYLTFAGGSFYFQLQHNDATIAPDTEPTPPPYNPAPTPTNSNPPTPTIIPSPSPTAGWSTPTYTRESAQKRLSDLQKDLAEMQLDRRQLEIDHENSKRRLNDATVYSTIEGTVTGLLDPEYAQRSGEPVMTVTGGDGYYVRGTVSELNLDSVQVGQRVDIMSWYSGIQCQGEIVEVGTYPADSSVGGGSSNISYYPFTVYVPAEYKLIEGEYVEMTLVNSGSSERETIYLDRAYIREDEDTGLPYVYIADVMNDDRLLRVDVQTGGLLWGSYVEITAGLSGSEYIAFPYGSDVREGVRTEKQENPYYFYY